MVTVLLLWILVAPPVALCFGVACARLLRTAPEPAATSGHERCSGVLTATSAR